MKRWTMAALLAAVAALCPVPAAAQQKDYLTGIEADKIRDAETSDRRIRLFLEFAADRLKKFEYELARPAADRRRGERLNFLLNSYVGCVDDAAELIDLGREKQDDIRKGIEEMLKRAKEFLAFLEKLRAGGPELESYRETLDDAIEGTQDAIADAEKASKEIAPPPVRRRPS